ncbi:MAG: hypothetical protein JO033_25570, partial [Acidobacteriaceae bacterium]|nr:hypothetical protein [Acidobacteriaceae bacterium]
MNGHRQTIRARGVVALIAAVVMGVLGLRASSALADEPIVGFWQVTFTDKATGKVASYVWDVWHSDRTETQNDTGNILSGNVCQGAWVPLGKRTYGLTHPAFIFADPTHP